ncbi:uncharacterized protein F13E9.13, mitochondrial [Uranotaenia lowii]|uniref:uncharacterized protein F13E9.13, mitochondrial n=1 Tax=Uranotaenia lowii TaxID=190385 RepID=UPI00247A8639|nr:uncharacterized protein F13E9.13, mitochondrial [Uranotaenia lowii]
MSMLFKRLFPQKFAVIGMIHVDPLPGTPLFKGNFETVVSKAIDEANIYLTNGVDGIMIENMHDIPYIQSSNIGPETIACMTRVASMVKLTVGSSIPCGVQILACGNIEALAVAKACNLDFIRAEGFVFSHVADEGFTDACAGKILRYRKNIDASNVAVLTDIKKKHSSHAITKDISILEAAQAAEFFLSDGIILTGTSTGSETNVDDILCLKNKIDSPLIVGSGVTLDNVERYWHLADAAIIGSYFKQGGNWKNQLDEQKISDLISKLKCFRKQ